MTAFWGRASCAAWGEPRTAQHPPFHEPPVLSGVRAQTRRRPEVEGDGRGGRLRLPRNHSAVIAPLRDRGPTGHGATTQALSAPLSDCQGVLRTRPELRSRSTKWHVCLTVIEVAN